MPVPKQTTSRKAQSKAAKKFSWRAADVEGVWIGEAAQPGPTVGIMGGVHGDERAGVEFVLKARSTIKVKRGTVILMLGNLAAIKLRKRYTDINLNRHFNREGVARLTKGKVPYEAARADELLPYLDQCEAVLDLHEYNNVNDAPFIICERDTLETALKIGAPVISFGWSKTEHGGSDCYMHTQGKQGMAYELGPRSTTAKNVLLAEQVVPRFLAAQGLIDTIFAPLFAKPKFIQTVKAINRAEGEYKLAREFTSFEPLVPGELVAINGNEQIYAEPGEVIIFPEPSPPVGDEAFLIGEIVER